jgi:hypothetical protein
MPGKNYDLKTFWDLLRCLENPAKVPPTGIEPVFAA